MEVTGDIVLFLAATGLGATAIVLHMIVLWLLVRPGSGAGAALRTLAVLLPPVAPLAAWRLGRRVAAVLWVLVIVAYVAVRIAYVGP